VVVATLFKAIGTPYATARAPLMVLYGTSLRLDVAALHAHMYIALTAAVLCYMSANVLHFYHIMYYMLQVGFLADAGPDLQNPEQKLPRVFKRLETFQVRMCIHCNFMINILLMYASHGSVSVLVVRVTSA
jgi:hypothetical protein